MNVSEEFLNEIYSKYDKNKVIEQLKKQSTEYLIIKNASELNYVIRKFELNYSDFNIKPRDALDSLSKCSEEKKNDVYIMIGYMIEKSKDEIDDKMIVDIKNLLETCSNPTKWFLETQIKKTKDIIEQTYNNSQMKRINKRKPLN